MRWASGGYRYKLLREGQAEVIGGLIAISVLLFSIAAIYFLMTSTQSSYSTEFVRRTSFESERSAEKIAVNYDPASDSCIATNIGASSIRIVRLWSGGTYTTGDALLAPGQSLSWSYSQAPDLMVTARGNVFTIKAECEKIRSSATNIQQIISGSGIASTLFTSENLLNNLRISRGMQKGYLYAVINENNYAVFYYNGSKYLCSDYTGNGIVYIVHDDNDKSIQSQVNWDLDSDGINEAIISSFQTCPNTQQASINIDEYTSDVKGSLFKEDSASIKFVFKNLLSVPQNVDTITIYFKLVAMINVAGGGNPHDITFAPYVEITSSSGLSLKAPASTAVVSRGQSTESGIYIVVISGYAVFPVRGFGLNLPPGAYDLTIDVQVVQQPGNVNLNRFRLEYLAIVGAYINDPWR